MPVLGSLERARFSDERARDDSAHFVLAAQNAARRLANLVEARDGYDLFVRGYLKDGIGGGVDDGFARADVLLAEFFDYLRAGGRVVAEDAGHARLGDEALDDVGREPFGVSWERAFEYDAGHLPVPRSRVLSVRAERAATERRARLRDGRHARERAYVP